MCADSSFSLKERPAGIRDENSLARSARILVEPPLISMRLMSRHIFEINPPLESPREGYSGQRYQHN